MWQLSPYSVGNHRVTEEVTSTSHKRYIRGTATGFVEHNYQTRRSVLATGSTLGFVGLAGCIGDENDDDSGSNGSTEGSTLTLKGELDDFEGEEGEITPDYIHTNSRLTAGNLESDGTFALTIEESDLEPDDEDDFGDPVTLMDSLNLRCADDVNAQITDDARFTWFTHLRVADIDRDEVSFITAMTDPDGCEPSFANCPNANAEYVTWVYTTHDVEHAVDCGDESIDLSLTEGWNVVLQNEYDRNDQSTASIQSLDAAFETVSWYYNDQ